MKIEDQVCTLEQAKRLKELGVVQESEFYWMKWITVLEDGTEHEWKVVFNKAWGEYYSAYTVAESGVMLPDVTVSYRNLKGFYCIGFENPCFESNTEAEA